MLLVTSVKCLPLAKQALILLKVMFEKYYFTEQLILITVLEDWSLFHHEVEISDVPSKF